MDSRSITRSSGPRVAVWPAILAALAGLGLLLAFYQVVRGAVDQAALRRQAVAVQADASWRCQWLPGHGASQHCLIKLESMPTGHEAAPGRVVLLAAGR